MTQENTQTETTSFENMNHNKRMSFICKRLVQRQNNKTAKKTVLALLKK